MKQQLKVRITENGEIHAETIGIKGEACMGYIQLLENMLEAETVDSSFTKEYFETEELDVHQVQLNKEKD